MDIISTMLGDNSTFTIGSVLMAFNQVCPDRLDLIHPQYRKLCKMLVDMDEWGQITAMDLLLRYSRYNDTLYSWQLHLVSWKTGYTGYIFKGMAHLTLFFFFLQFVRIY